MQAPHQRQRGAPGALLGSLQVLLACSLLGACGGSGDGQSAAEAGLREVVEWYDEFETLKLSEGQTRYGKEVGDWRWFHRDGSLQRTGAFVDGAQVGEWLTYYPGGSAVQMREHWTTGRLDGEREVFYEDGASKERVAFVDGQEEGTYEAWYPSGALAVRMEFQQGVAKSREDFHETGERSAVVPIDENGNKHGLEVRTYPDGSKLSEVLFVAGVRSGPTRGWFANGELQLDGQYEKDHPVGLWRQFHPNGKLRLEGNWALVEGVGREIGTWRAYHDSGELDTVAPRADGSLHGRVQSWHPGGRRATYGMLVASQRQGAFFVWNAEGVLDLEQSGLYKDEQRQAPLGEAELARAAELAADPSEHPQPGGDAQPGADSDSNPDE